jgi:hypothetical protein
LSFFRDFLFNIFASTLHCWRPSLHPEPFCVALSSTESVSYAYFYIFTYVRILGSKSNVFQILKKLFRKYAHVLEETERGISVVLILLQ